MSEVQEQIIGDIDNNVSVAAGAGTGKTYTLTHRFVNILEQNAANPGFSIANVVAITFTKAAAAEMRECTRKVLQERLAATGNKRLQEFLQSFDQVRITTIDSLQGKILREHPVEAGVDPNFAVQEEVEYANTVLDLTSRFLRREAQRQNADLVRLVYVFGFGKLRSDLVDLAQTSRQQILLQGSVEELADRVFKTIFSGGQQDSGELSEEGGDTAEDNLADLPGTLAEEKELAVVWLRFYRQYAEFLEQEKRSRDIFGFDDVARRCVEFLKAHAVIRRDYQKKIRYLMVDEFQDTNDAQREFVYLLCGDPEDGSEPGSCLCGRKLFVVGDYKQSIYGFRDADVRVFEKVQAHIRAAAGRSYSITENRRSTDKILRLVNYVFAHEDMLGEKYEPLTVFSGNVTDESNPREKPLVRFFVRKKPDEQGTETAVSDKDVEADYAARYIRELAAEGKKFSSITVLLAKMTRVKELVSALVRYHIPYVVLGGRDFYQRQEIYDILNVLRVLKDRENDVALLGVLRSPYFGWDDVAVTGLCDRAGKSSCCLWEALEDCEVKRILEKLCLAARCLPVLELWQTVLESLRADFILNRQANGRQLWANVLKLRQLCQSYCARHGTGLAEWLKFLDATMEGSKERAADLSASDAVQIMTVHGSKGLGFDQVVLPFLGDEREQGDRCKVCINREDNYFAVAFGNDEEKSSSFALVREQNRDREDEEKLRLLYVAMTRARKGLYLSGMWTAPKKDKSGAENRNLKNGQNRFRSHMARLQNVLTDDGGNFLEEVAGFCRLEKVEIDGSLEAPEAGAGDQDRAGFHFCEVQRQESGQQVFSPSMLQSYLHCQRRYYYQYVLGLPEWENVHAVGGAVAVGAADLGSLLHKALEFYHGDVSQALDRAVQDQKFSCPPSDRQDIERLFAAYVQSKVFQDIPSEHEREVAFRLPVQDGVAFQGIIDCLYQKPDGTYGVVDYKTGQVPAGLNRGYALQLAVYGRAVELMKRSRVTDLALHYLRGPKVFHVGSGDCSFDDAVALAREMAAKTQEQDYRCDGDCTHCNYTYVCRKDG